MGVIKADNFRAAPNSTVETMTGNKVLTEGGLDTLAKVLHTSAIEKGFWDGDITLDRIGNKLALVHSEVTEVLEAIRKEKGGYAVVEEMADILIRLLDLYAAMLTNGMVVESLDNVLSDKIDKNRSRPRLHGNLF